MNIHINGDLQHVNDGITAAQLVEFLGLTGKRLAMEINYEIVPRSTYNDHRIQADDHIEIVHAIGGG